MQKLKFSLLALLLMVLTIAVFAGKKHFYGNGLYVTNDNINYYQVSSDPVYFTGNLSYTGSNQVRVTDVNGTYYYMYYLDSYSIYEDVYTSGTW